MSLFVRILIAAVAGYLFGCLNGSMMASHFIIKDDVRTHGSGNAGLTNFYRTYGARHALVVILCDMLKTVVAALIGGALFAPLGQRVLGVLIAGIACSLGHIFPVFFSFRGGKGILSGGTLLWFIDWRVGLVAWVLFALLWLTTRYVSLGSVVSSASAPVTTFFVFDGNPLYTLLCLALAALVIWCHRGNIVRLVKGTENKFQWHKDAPKVKGETQ